MKLMKVVRINGPRPIVVHYSFILDGKLTEENLIVMHLGYVSWVNTLGTQLPLDQVLLLHCSSAEVL